MKTRLELSDHLVIEGAHVVELWYGGVLIGTVTGANGPGVRIQSKYPKSLTLESELTWEISITPTPNVA